MDSGSPHTANEGPQQLTETGRGKASVLRGPAGALMLEGRKPDVISTRLGKGEQRGSCNKRGLR